MFNCLTLLNCFPNWLLILHFPCRRICFSTSSPIAILVDIEQYLTVVCFGFSEPPSGSEAVGLCSLPNSGTASLLTKLGECQQPQTRMPQTLTVLTRVQKFFMDKCFSISHLLMVNFQSPKSLKKIFFSSFIIVFWGENLLTTFG